MNVRLMRLSAGVLLNLKNGGTYRVESNVPEGSVVVSTTRKADGTLLVLVGSHGFPTSRVDRHNPELHVRLHEASAP